MNKVPAIGIDLGTTDSCVGVWRNEKVEIILNDMGERTTPSYMSFSDTGILFGNVAKQQVSSNPTNTIFDSKRLIGHKFQDKEIQEDIKLFPFKVINDPILNKPLIQIIYQKKEKKCHPEEITAMILNKLKKIASDFLGKEAKDAVITVPTYFNYKQRQTIKNIGTKIGLNIVRIIDTSTAAGIAYGFDKQIKERKNIIIFDLGGGSLNISLLSFEDGMFEVLATNGNTHLGGEDFDNRLINYCYDAFIRKTSIDFRTNPKALRRVRIECEKAKKALSSTKEATIDIDCLMDGEDLTVSITRSKFEGLCLDLFQNCIYPLEQILKDSQINRNQIDDIILVGGSTRMPKIQQMIKEFFNGQEPNKNLNPDESIAYGAAIQAALLSSDIKSDKLKNLIIFNIIPFSLGIELAGGIMKVLINKNQQIPFNRKLLFTTNNDNQTGILIKVYEGEKQLTKDNSLLGIFYYDKIPPMPKGKAKIEITYDIDENSNLIIIVEEKSSGKNNKMIMNYDRLIKETEKFAKINQSNQSKYCLVEYH